MYKTTIKIPNSKKCMDCDNIDDWLYDTMIKYNIWTGELFYNDNPPNSIENAHTGGGHSKGVLLWNETELGWLVHSLPDWPETLLNDIPHAETEYAQSFIWIILPIEKLSNILLQLQLMHTHVYHDPSNVFVPLKHHPLEENSLRMIQLSENIYHIAKHEIWKKDLFEDGLVVEFPGSKWMTCTWGRPLQSPTTNVGRVKKIHWKNNNIICEYNEHQDHSKWAISDKETCCVWIGDINAMISQFHRGGGGIIIKGDQDLWYKFNKIIM